MFHYIIYNIFNIFLLIEHITHIREHCDDKLYQLIKKKYILTRHGREIAKEKFGGLDIFSYICINKTINTMSILKFSDGEEFDTSVELQLTLRKDGWYVIGNGLLIPVRDLDEGRKELKKQKEKRKLQRIVDAATLVDLHIKKKD